MKMIIAIVQDEDGSRLTNKLMQSGYRATKLASTGGFLRSGYTTLLIGIEDEKTEKVLKIIEENCKSRKQFATAPSTISGATGMYVPYAIEVTVGGATVFILDVEQYIRL